MNYFLFNCFHLFDLSHKSHKFFYYVVLYLYYLIFYFVIVFTLFCKISYLNLYRIIFNSLKKISELI